MHNSGHRTKSPNYRRGLNRVLSALGADKRRLYHQWLKAFRDFQRGASWKSKTAEDHVREVLAFAAKKRTDTAKAVASPVVAKCRSPRPIPLFRARFGQSRKRKRKARLMARQLQAVVREARSVNAC